MGSVPKVFIASAVAQLVERSLRNPVSDFSKGVQIVQDSSEPVTSAQRSADTVGSEEALTARWAYAPEDLIPCNATSRTGYGRIGKTSVHLDPNALDQPGAKHGGKKVTDGSPRNGCRELSVRTDIRGRETGFLIVRASSAPSVPSLPLVVPQHHILKIFRPKPSRSGLTPMPDDGRIGHKVATGSAAIPDQPQRARPHGVKAPSHLSGRTWCLSMVKTLVAPRCLYPVGRSRLANDVSPRRVWGTLWPVKPRYWP